MLCTAVDKREIKGEILSSFFGKERPPMKNFSITKISGAIFYIFVLCSYVWCDTNPAGVAVDSAPMERSEKEALYSAIQGFVGSWWNGSDLYPDPCGWTPIQGVSCDLFDGFWYVTALKIAPVQDDSLTCGATANFSQRLFELKHLKTLSFLSCFKWPHKNAVSIPLGSWFNFSGSLESLEFRWNHGLVGHIPADFGNLSHLQSLVLIENELTGELPESIGSLTGLKRLVLSGNKLVGRIPESFGGLSQLLILDLSRNSLHGHLPSSFGGLGSLLKLDLSNNQLDGKLPKEIGNLKNLTLLDLGNNSLTGGLISSLEELSSLEEMVLSNNNLMGGEVKSVEWPSLTELAILDLSNAGLMGDIPESIAELKRLRYLSLSDNNLVGIVSPKLEGLPSVSALYLHGNNLTGELRFSRRFYQKMGRRFGAWSNPSLCYQVDQPIPAGDAPVGVKACPSPIL